MQTVKDINRWGLSIISWDLSDDDSGREIHYQGSEGVDVGTLLVSTLYAVSVDGAAPGEPSTEQKDYCDWWIADDIAAAAYQHAPATSNQ